MQHHRLCVTVAGIAGEVPRILLCGHRNDQGSDLVKKILFTHQLNQCGGPTKSHRALAVSLVRPHCPAQVVLIEYLLRIKVPDDVRWWFQCPPNYTTHNYPTTCLHVPGPLSNQFCPRHCRWGYSSTLLNSLFIIDSIDPKLHSQLTHDV